MGILVANRNDNHIRMENAGLGDLIKNALLNAYLSWFTDYNDFITKETWILSIKSVTINYDKVPQVNVAKAPDNGLKNTMELYNFNGLSDVSTLISILEDWGGTTTDVLPLNPDEFAARACAMKNKYNKTVETQPGTSETIQVPVLKEENLVWYLPAKNEASQMKDETYPLQGEYWTSTVAVQTKTTTRTPINTRQEVLQTSKSVMSISVSVPCARNPKKGIYKN